MKIVADHVYPDEPCWGLHEGPYKVHGIDGSQEWHWVQRVFVIRGDNIACWTQDFGSTEFFPRSTETVIPSFGENTVAELQDLAERSRYSDKYYKHQERVASESTLIADVVRNIQMRHEAIRNRSNFGPGVSVQRGEYSRERTQRKLKEMTRARTGRT